MEDVVATPSAERSRTNSTRRGTRRSAIFGDTLLSRVAQILIGAAATFLVVDILIKQNYQSYLTEISALKESILEANEDINKLRIEVSNLFVDRVYSARNMNDLAAHDNVVRFSEYYEDYYKTVEEWNLGKGEVARKIRAATGCENVVDNDQLAKYIRTLLLDPYWPVNREPLFRSASRVTSDEFSTRSESERYCPDAMLFSARGADPLEEGGGFQSAFEVLRYIHQLFVDSTRREVVQCSVAAKLVQDRKLASCDAKRVRFWGKNYYVKASTCILYALRSYAPAKLCPDPWYRDLADVSAARFQTIEYRIAVSLEMLELYRAGYVRKVCESKRGFWSTLMRVDCDRLAADISGAPVDLTPTAALASLRG